MKDHRNPIHLGAWGGLALLIIIALPLSAAAATTGVSPLITNLEFSAGPPQNGAPTLLPMGTPPSYLFAEQMGPFVIAGPPDSADDDVYRADLTLPAVLPFSNVKIVDDGFPTIPVIGTGIVPPPGIPPYVPPPGIVPPPQCTIPTDAENIDALAVETGLVPLPTSAELARTALLSGTLFVQFSVDNFALGLPGTGVNLEAIAVPPEQAGDVYESAPGTLTNVVIADEDASGLALPGPPQDDLDALILEQSVMDGGPFWDTDGDGSNDTPFFMFSVDKPFVTAGPVGFFSAADIMTPGPSLAPATPAPEPTLFIAEAALGLVPGDNIDAFYMDATFGVAMYSLAAGSPSLATTQNLAVGGIGADPGDIIHVTPVTPPCVVIGSNEIGLRGTLYGDPADDELNALCILDASLAAPLEIPVELSVFWAD
ncbi:hypothetical protein JXA47_16580 [Candidatus Sumerlaeota bacterium]|nr:hypothetical protein [Candidatus Sumerlaeota bacterium]